MEGIPHALARLTQREAPAPPLEVKSGIREHPQARRPDASDGAELHGNRQVALASMRSLSVAANRAAAGVSTGPSSVTTTVPRERPMPMASSPFGASEWSGGAFRGSLGASQTGVDQ
jgi:hypothetical protein